MHLHKNIPVGAGMGGGSANGAFVLKMLNQKFSLGITENQLISYALQLGSDCPFFIINKPCLGTGRGEQLKPIALNLSAYTILIVNPGIHINTAWAFSQITPALPHSSLEEIIHTPVARWKNELINDFEAPVSKAYPAIATVINTLYSKNALFAGMTGSGSTVIGIFNANTDTSISFPPEYFVKTIPAKN